MTVGPDTARRLSAHLARVQSDGRLPSVVAALVRDGDVAWVGERGGARGPAAGSGPARGVQYRIGSITKTLTAVTILQLVEEGSLGFEDPVGEVLGDIGYADRTIRALLTHSSGAQAEPVGDWWERSPGVEWSELVTRHDGSGAVLPVGRQFHYSNLAYALLGRVAAQLRGQEWWPMVHERILEPLGMTRTTYVAQAPSAQGYSVHPYARTLTEEPATDTRAMAPAGQAWSTADDLATYARFLLDGHPDVLPREVLLGALHPQSGDRESALAAAHGLGFMLVSGGSGMLSGHSGSMPGFLAACYVDHPRRTGAVLLANATTGLRTAQAARRLMELLDECEPAMPATWVPTQAVPPEVADLLGVWHWGNTPHTFTWEGEELVIWLHGAPEYRGVVRDGQVVGTTGYHAGETVQVIRTAAGAVSRLEISTFVFTREPHGP